MNTGTGLKGRHEGLGRWEGKAVCELLNDLLLGQDTLQQAEGQVNFPKAKIETSVESWIEVPPPFQSRIGDRSGRNSKNGGGSLGLGLRFRQIRAAVYIYSITVPKNGTVTRHWKGSFL